MENLETKNNIQVFNRWFSDHPNLSPYIKVFSHNSSNFDFNLFVKQCKGVHNRTIDELTTFIANLNQMISNLRLELTTLSSKSAPVIPKLEYDDNRVNLKLRKISFLQQKIYKREVSLRTHRFEVLDDLLTKANLILDLYTSNIIPPGQLCRLDPLFFTIHFGSIVHKDLRYLNYLKPAVENLQKSVKDAPKPLWSTNYNEFLLKIVKEAEPRIDPELSYFLPNELEVSLSRCLFNPQSQFISKIDTVLHKIKNAPSQKFIKTILKTCYKMIVSPDSMSVFQQSIALLILYRALFNRFYEKYSYLFSPNQPEIREKSCSFDSLAISNTNDSSSNSNLNESSSNSNANDGYGVKSILNENSEDNSPPIFSKNDDFQLSMNQNSEKFKEFLANEENFNSSKEDVEKITKIKMLPSKLFPLPWDLISIDQKKCENLPVRELFELEPTYRNASLFLYQAIFDSTPIDALYNVHKSLILIHKGALINRMKGASASIDDVNQILCFDDLFSLFFGTMTASDVPDIFSLAKFIDKYAPKPCLSPSFEYAQANIEALVIHCKNIELDKLESEIKIPEKNENENNNDSNSTAINEPQKNKDDDNKNSNDKS